MNKTFCVYILLCQDGSLYAGITNNLERRFEQHATGKGGRYTRSHGAKKIVYSKKFKNRSAASKREYQIKQLSRTEKLKLIKNENHS